MTMSTKGTPEDTKCKSYTVLKLTTEDRDTLVPSSNFFTINKPDELWPLIKLTLTKVVNDKIFL